MGVKTGWRRLGVTPGHEGQSPKTAGAFMLTAGDLSAEVWTYGATLAAVWVPDRQGVVEQIVRPRGPFASCVGVSDRGGYQGATVGRYANRIANGRFSLDGKSYTLERNDGPNHLHGGRIGFDQYVWDADPRIEEGAVVLSHTSRDGDEGYPGRVEASVSYTLTEQSLIIEYHATTDAPTLVNLTNHAYWNLAGGGSIGGHTLNVAASRYLPVDDTAIPTGEIAPVAGTGFDFLADRLLDEVLVGGGLDHCFLLDHGQVGAARLTHPESGRQMVVVTDQPAIQVYTANFLDPAHTAICLETQVAPDSPNQPALGSAILRPGQTYHHRTVHTFGISGG